MIEVTPVMDGPDYSDMIEVVLDRLDLEAWDGGSAGVLFTFDTHSAGDLFAKLGDALREIKGQCRPVMK